MTMSTPSIPAAVVKDDAYGIGAKMVAQTLYKKAHCRHFFVAHAKEGADIRPYIPDATIYVLQGIGADTLAFFEKYNLIPVISSPEMLKFWQQYQIEGIKPAIQIETGLNRLGFRKEELEELFNPNNQTLNTHLNCHPTELLSQSSSDTTSPSQASSEEDTFSLQSSSDTTSPSWSSSRHDVSHSTSGIHEPVRSTLINNDSTLAHPQENLKPNTDNSPSTVILEAMRQHQHVGDPQTSALAHNNDSDLAHPQEDLRQNTDNSPSTVILEAMRQHQHIGDPQTSALAHNNDSDLAHPQNMSECRRSYDHALAHPHHPQHSHSQYSEKDFSLVLSHLSCADEQSHFMNYRQLENFIELKNKYFPNTMSSLSASDGVFLSTEFHFDMVRLGAAMYGINTAPYRENEMQNIVELKAPVLQVANANKGDFIGYSATYKCSKAMKIAIVSIGYGDGVPRSLSNKGKVLFYEHGVQHLCPILGRVSMDNIICDVSCLESIKVGDFGIIINQDYTVDDVAKDADTIAYELISRIGKNPRILKNYIDE